MGHTPSGTLVNLWRRLPRAVAVSVAALAELSPGRALMALVVSLGFGTSAAFAVASVGGSAIEAAQPAVLTQRPMPTASRDGERPVVPGSTGLGPQGNASPWSEPTTGRSSAPTAPDRQEEERGRTAGSPPRAAHGSRTPRAGSSASSTPRAEPGGEESPSSTDDNPPRTSIDASFPDGDTADFSYTASESASYECSLDGASYTPCDSPSTFSNLHPGWHVFAVRATDAAGNVDPSPAIIRWHANAGSAGAPQSR